MEQYLEIPEMSFQSMKGREQTQMQIANWKKLV
jgi:hypothetical protein